MSPFVNRRLVALYVSLALASACGPSADPAPPAGAAQPAPDAGRTGGDAQPAAGGAATAALRIKMVSGNGQSGAAGAALADPLVVRVTDMDGSGVASVAVTWAVTSGGGRVSAAATATDPGGVASVTATLGAAAGTNTFSATAAGQVGPPAVFAATGTTGQPPPDGHPPRIVVRSGPCAGMTVPPDDHDTFWLGVEQPDGPHRHHGRGPEDGHGHHDGHAHHDHRGGAHPGDGHPHHPPRPEPRLAVDAHGQVAVGGDVRWPATMVDVTDEAVTAFTFTYDRPPHHFGHRAAAWETSLRPPHLGSNLLCVRAKVHHEQCDHDGPDGDRHDDGHDGDGRHDGHDHDGWDDDHDDHDDRDGHDGHDGHPHGHEHFVRILRPFTAVDPIPPSAVPGLEVGSITATGATATWGAATDNYGLAGYAVRIDGGAAHRVSAGTRRYVIRGLSPSTRHTVSVVAVDLAGNTSAAPATASFTTAAAPATPPGGDLTITPQEGSAIAAWHPNPLVEVAYRATLDDEVLGELPLAEYCQDAAGNPASPCTAQHTMRFPVSVLEQETPYTLKLEALRADGTVARTLSGTFTTTAGPVVVPESLEEEIASESAQCAGMGGKVYLSPSARAAVTMPAGATQLFGGCYKVADSSCVDANLKAGANKLLGCSDDVTRLMVQLAPKGRGPVISSLDGVVSGPTAPPIPRIPAQRTPIEPQGRMPEGRPPLTEFRFPEEFERVPKVPALPFVVLAAEIAAVVVIDVVLPIAFAEELGIAGLFEYPIHFDTDFDTFDNWGANRGNYYNSLKVYAEVIKTTTLYAQGSNLPFKWDETEDQNLKLSIDRACSAQRGSPSLSTPYGCSSNEFVVYVPGGRNYRLQPMPKTGEHIATAMSDAALTADPARVQWFYPAYSRGGRAARAAGFRRRWFDTLQFQPNPCSGRIGQVCDEFPFWSTSQAVNLSGIRASLARVPLLEAAPQGNDLSQFYRRCKVNDNDPFLVLPIEPWIAAGGPSFGFRVKQGAVDLCLVPSP